LSGKLEEHFRAFDQKYCGFTQENLRYTREARRRDKSKFHFMELQAKLTSQIAAQTGHGEEDVGTTQGYFSPEEIIVCASTHTHSVGVINFNHRLDDRNHHALP